MVKTQLNAAGSRPIPSKKAGPAFQKPAKPVSYPWDSHQNDITVRSIEVDRTSLRVGVDHYRQALAAQKDYQHICTDFDTDYRRNGTKKENIATMNGPEDEDNRDWQPDLTIDYTVAPSPPATRSEYKCTIFMCTTTNPAVFLSIVRVAQRNTPFIDFTSALSHLPNHPPVAPLPVLTPGTFPGDILHILTPTCITYNVVFLPNFYEDGRHALGYFRLPPDTTKVSTCLFTPCTTDDLEAYDLILYLEGRRADGTNGETCVGERTGKWLHPEDEEEWEEWRTGYRVAKAVWENRLRLMRVGMDGEQV
jgi:hypothetical protein